MAASSAPAPDAVGLGLRRALLGPLRAATPGSFDFLEAAPENWIGVGGALGEAFAELASRHPIVCHGLSLSLGGPGPLDETFLGKLRRFLDAHRVPIYSEHLSACSDGHGQLYDLMPLPFTDAAVEHVAARIRRTQDALGRRIAVENISYYATLQPAGMTEVDFINTVLERADCDLLLDVNNIVVNATNHGYDALEFLGALPGERIAYIHVAGHFDEADDLKIDTHGAAVSDPVWALLGEAYRRFGPRPTLLERDFNLPPLDELLGELDIVRGHLSRAGGRRRRAA
ncbi:HvfB family MNIO-type RiPP peptide maturase [Lysobacter sp. F60174L2]|uniref:HvfB family MNIO-type RiPP peptide maturase n=1 Tax=Lysobacter sp. F60174L2 TaxID=3459295 RepID=UPI00403D84EA